MPDTYPCQHSSGGSRAGLVRMQRQRELPQPLAHRVPEAPGVSLALEADHDVVRVADDDHVARGLASSPARGPHTCAPAGIDSDLLDELLLRQPERDPRPARL